MAYSSVGKKVYISIKDLPQYSSLEQGDKLIIWNETRDGAAVVDFGDVLINLDQCTFKSTISEVINVADQIQSFVAITSETIENIEKSIEEINTTIESELRSRIKALEFIVAVILGGNSYWLSSNGLDTLRTKFIQEGISAADGAILDTLETEEERESYKWYTGLITTIQNYVAKMSPGVEADDILLQSKFRYKYTDAVTTQSAAEASSTFLNSKTVIKSGDTKTEIYYTNKSDSDV